MINTTTIKKEDIMTRYTDTIQFEKRKEVRDLLEFAEKYKKQNPDENNQSLERLVECLEEMDVCW